MAQDYDVVLRLLFRSQSNQAVREIAGGPVKRWLDKELPAIRNTRAQCELERLDRIPVRTGRTAPAGRFGAPACRKARPCSPDLTHCRMPNR